MPRIKLIFHDTAAGFPADLAAAAAAVNFTVLSQTLNGHLTVEINTIRSWEGLADETGRRLGLRADVSHVDGTIVFRAAEP